MGQPLWLSVLNVSVMPSLLGSFALFYVANRFDWSGGFTLLMFFPFWLLGFFAWCIGAGSMPALVGLLRGTSTNHPPCPICSEPLATQYARQCLSCGADWHDDAGS